MKIHTTHIIVLVVLVAVARCQQSLCEYEELREQLIKSDSINSQSFTTDFSTQEVVVDHYLHTLKQIDVDSRFLSNKQYQFLAAHNFFKVKDQIEDTKLFKILKKMPKGGQLHLHTGASYDFKAVIEHIFATPSLSSRLYLLYCDEVPMEFGYFASAEDAAKKAHCTGKRQPSCQWRSTSVNTTEELYQFVVLGAKDLPYGENDYESDQMWNIFSPRFRLGSSLTAYKPIFEYSILNSLQNMEQDGVSFVEYRNVPGYIYTLDGPQNGTETDSCGRPRVSNIEETSIIKRTIEYMANTTNLVSGSYIYSVSRVGSVEQMKKTMEVFWQLRNDPYLKDFMVGVDFVAEEDKGRSLYHLYAAMNNTVDYFFHSGETVQPRDIESPNLMYHTNDEATEYNLVDAVLNNAKRIGHGIALQRHPYLMEQVRKKGICVELCPISNQVLSYVKDLRTHPAVLYIANGLKVVVASDDPGIMAYVNMTYDSYVAYTSWGINLQQMKQMVMNSIECSSINKKAKEAVTKVTNSAWDNFIDNLYDEVCTMSEAQILQMRNSVIHCSRVQGIQVSRLCKSVDVDYSSAIDFSFADHSLSFCDNVTCIFNTLEGNEVARVKGVVMSPCQIRCMTPTWSDHGKYNINVLRNDASICGNNSCTMFQFFGKQDELQGKRWLIGLVIAVFVIAALVSVIIYTLPKREKKVTDEESVGLIGK
jgi:adenosine deaminase CECR1